MKTTFTLPLLFSSITTYAYPLAESTSLAERSTVQISQRNDIWQPRSPGFFDKLKELGESLEDEIKENYNELKDQLDKVSDSIH